MSTRNVGTSYTIDWRQQTVTEQWTKQSARKFVFLFSKYFMVTFTSFPLSLKIIYKLVMMGRQIDKNMDLWPSCSIQHVSSTLKRFGDDTKILFWFSYRRAYIELLCKPSEQDFILDFTNWCGWWFPVPPLCGRHNKCHFFILVTCCVTYSRR